MTENSENNRINTPKASRRQEQAERVDINLGHACNHKCVFCMQGTSKAEQRKWVPLQKFKDELKYYSEEKKITSLGLLGGEPTLYPWLEESLDYAIGLGYNDITLNTNGYKLADMNFATMAAKKGINRYCISLHSEIPEVEDYLSGNKGALIRKMTAIRNLLKLKKQGVANIVISINAVLNSRNLPTMDRFVKFFHHIGITDIRLNYIRPEGRAEGDKQLVPKYTESMNKLMELVKLNEKVHRIRLTFGEIPPCVFPSSFFKNDLLRNKYIGEYTDRRTFVTSFANQSDGRLADSEGKQRFVWQDLKMDELKSLTEECKQCAFVSVCGGVWKNYLEMHGDSEFKALK